MSSLAQTIANAPVRPGTVMAWWLSGTGFVFKTHAGTQIYVDPYFTNSALGIFDLQRAVPPPVPVEEAQPDLVIATHWHEDHLDPEGIPLLAARSSTKFLAPPSARSRMLGWRIAKERVTAITEGQSHTFRDLTVTAMPARHHPGLPGWEVPDAMGLMLEVDGLRIYYTGDTEYDLRLRALGFDKAHPIDVMFTVINGAGGNMNAHEAALLAWHLHPKMVIPMHHILWKDFTGGEQATLDPTLFRDTYQRLGGTGQVILPEVGEGFELSKVGTVGGGGGAGNG